MIVSLLEFDLEFPLLFYFVMIYKKLFPRCPTHGYGLVSRNSPEKKNKKSQYCKM